MADAPLPVSRHLSANRVVLGCLLSLLLGTAALVGLYLIRMPGAHPSLAKVERFSSLEFPPSARLLDSHGRSFAELHVLAKVEMDTADVEPFVRSLPGPLTISETDKHRICQTTYAMKWWDPGTARRFRAIEIEKEASERTKVWHILIRLDDPQKAVVYLDYCSF